MSSCVVVPAFEEEDSIGSVVSSLLPCAPVIVVDDGSRDGTARAAAAAGAIVVVQEANGGYGAAVDRGFREAVRRGFRFVVTADADGQHAPEDVREFTRLLESGLELVVGVRPGGRRLVERLCAAYARRALGVSDPLCGLKGYDLRYYRDYGSFDRRRSVGTELMAYAIRRRARWTERPIVLRPRSNGRSRFYGRARANLRILRSLLALATTR